MTASEIVHSWKDEDYQSRYQGAEMAFMPGNPAGLIELTDDELLGVDGAITPVIASAAVGASAGAIVSIALTAAAITIYRYFSS
ncbi:MAG: mersacidin/lichenicidin family type 2 lantibiotic [Acidobacteria bacterium]|nr:mersacidin/lichenicidin family type 2 lantibiotic [Acidobacteriota bacterium]